jgi:hypothetical protein
LPSSWLNVVIGTGLFTFGLPIDPYRYGRRLMYLGVLSLMMVWPSGEQRGPRSAPMPRAPGTPGERRNAILVYTLTFARVALQDASGDRRAAWRGALDRATA